MAKALLPMAVLTLLPHLPALRAGPGDDPPVELATYRLRAPDAYLSAGEVLEVLVELSSPLTLELATFSLEFESASLELLEAVLPPDFPSSADTSFQVHHLPAGEGGHDCVQGVLTLAGEGEGLRIPPGEAMAIALVRLRVKEGVEGEVQVRFAIPEGSERQGKLFDGEKYLFNSVRRRGAGGPDGHPLRGAEEGEIPDPVLRVPILGDVGLFNRFDLNGDGLVDITDPILLLDHLFLGGPAPASGVDPNGDGSLDLSDALFVLYELFVAG